MHRLLIAAVSFGLAAPAAAARVYTLTIDGTIASGIDTTGLVVAPGGSLAGLAYSFVGTFNDAEPGANLIAEENFSLANNAGTAVLRIGRGYSFAFDGSNSSQLAVQSEPADDVSTVVSGSCPGVLLCGFFAAGLTSSVNDFLAANDLGGPINHVWMPGDSFGGLFGLGGFGGGFYRLNAELGEEGTLLTLSAANVPEPASWAMLIAGFGLVGAAARRRRSQLSREPAR